MKRVMWGVDVGSVRETGDVGGGGHRIRGGVDAGSIQETGDVAGGRGIRSGNG